MTREYDEYILMARLCVTVADCHTADSSCVLCSRTVVPGSEGPCDGVPLHRNKLLARWWVLGLGSGIDRVLPQMLEARLDLGVC